MMLGCDGNAGHGERRGTWVEDEVDLKGVEVGEVGDGTDDGVLISAVRRSFSQTGGGNGKAYKSDSVALDGQFT